jgi:hypothetical protein
MRPPPTLVRMSNLVIVPTGDNSLHDKYSEDRDFELWAIYWGDNQERAEKIRESLDRLYIIKGLKWELLRSLMNIKVEFDRYDFIFCPDDDILFKGGATDISRLFRVAATVRADVFHPAISNEYYAWEVTRHISGLSCHATNIVDLMMPGFSGQMFSQCVLPILHALPHIRAGWGLQPTIMRLGEALLRRPVRTFVIDDVPAIHTRPVGGGTSSHEVGWDEAFILPNAYAFPGTELARFKVEAEAAAFEFPFSAPIVGMLENRMNYIRKARSLLHSFETRRSRRPMRRILNRLNRFLKKAPPIKRWS